MIKKHLVNLIDTTIIIFLIVIFALCGIITLLISDKIKDFEKEYKKKFYVYVLSFALIYVLIVFLSHNKPFTSLSRELLLYQIASLLFGILHVWIYRNYFQEFKLKSFIYNRTPFCISCPFVFKLIVYHYLHRFKRFKFYFFNVWALYNVHHTYRY
jgi:hypothetical protein